MPAINYKEALSWIHNSNEISAIDGKFVKLGFLDSIAFKFIPSCQADHITKLVAFIEKQAWNKAEKESLLELSNVIIKRCDSGFSTTKKISECFERRLVAQGIKSTYLNQSNLEAFAKWQRNGLPDKIFRKYPHFYDYLAETGLLSQLKITRDILEERYEEPGLLVEGRWTSLSRLKNKFEVIESPQYGEKFYINKKTRKVYTYLDNGLGLEAHHPYVDGLRPISKLNNAEFQTVLNKGRQFVRPEDRLLSPSELYAVRQKRTSVIQIVSSFVEGSDTNVHNLISRAKHPYFNFIAGHDDIKRKMKKGDLFNIGFGYWNNVPFFPFSSTHGQFRSPDIWKYKSCQEIITTNIAVTPEEADKFFDYTQKYQRDEVNLGSKIGFHLAKQNCSVYVRKALKNINISVPTGTSLIDLIALIAPDFIKNTFKAIARTGKTLKMYVGKMFFFVPKNIRTTFSDLIHKIDALAKRLIKGSISLLIVPLRAGIGDAQGESGKAFSRTGEKEKAIAPPLHDWKNWFRLSKYKFHLPGILQNWQREQASTVIYKYPVKLAMEA